MERRSRENVWSPEQILVYCIYYGETSLISRYSFHISHIMNVRRCWRGASQPDLLCLQLIFYTVVQTLYTLGHSLSLIALITGSAILCLFR